MKAFTSDLSRSILSRAFLAAVMLMFIAMWWGASENIASSFAMMRAMGQSELAVGFHHNLVPQSLSSGVMLLFIPIIAALPFTTCFVDDIKSGFIKHFLPKAGFSKYIVSKSVACALSGALAIVAGLLLGYLTFSLVFLPFETYVPPEEMNWVQQMSATMFKDNIGQIAIYALSGMLWSLVGLTISSATMNKYMAYASPFIIYYVLVILAERYFRDVYVINPQNYLTLAGDWPSGALSACISMFLFCLGMGLLFYFTAQRRLRYE